MRKLFWVSPASASWSWVMWLSWYAKTYLKLCYVTFLNPDIPRLNTWSCVMCASSHKSDSKETALHLTFGNKFHANSFLTTHPECNPSDHCFWWSTHRARHWLRSSDGRDSVLYCSHALVEMSWLATKRDEDSDPMPDPDPDCPPARRVIVARTRWNNATWRNLTRSIPKSGTLISKGFIIPSMDKL